MSLKGEIKSIGSLTIEKPWRIVQPFLHLSVKEPPLTQYWNTNVHKVTFSTVEMALAF